MQVTKNYTTMDGASHGYIYEDKKIPKLFTDTSTAKNGSSGHSTSQLHKSHSQTQSMRTNKLQYKERQNLLSHPSLRGVRGTQVFNGSKDTSPLKDRWGTKDIYYHPK
jgi:hypothetical protein